MQRTHRYTTLAAILATAALAVGGHQLASEDSGPDAVDAAQRGVARADAVGGMADATAPSEPTARSPQPAPIAELDPATIDPTEIERLWHDADAEPFAIVGRMPDGRARTRIGKLRKARSLEPADLFDAIESTLAEGEPAPVTTDASEIAFGEVIEAPEGARVEIQQEWHGLRIQHGDMMASFRDDGWLYGLHGIRWADAGASLANAVDGGTPEQTIRLIEESPNEALRQAWQNGSRERVIDPVENRVLLVVDLGDDQFVIDEATAEVEHHALEHGQTRDRDLPTLDWPTPDTRVSRSIATTKRVPVSCWPREAYDFRSAQNGYRIRANFTPVRFDFCASPANPFDVTHGWPDRNGAYFHTWATETRALVDDLMWSRWSSSHKQDVEITVNALPSDCGSNACFKSSGGPRIYLELDLGDPVDDYRAAGWDTFAHEFGHYVVYSYGNFSGSGSYRPGLDEGWTLHEAVADAVSHLLIRTHPWSGLASQDSTYRPVRSNGNWGSIGRIRSRGYFDGTGCFPDLNPQAYFGPDSCHRVNSFGWTQNFVPGYIPRTETYRDYTRRYAMNPFRAALWQMFHNVRCLDGAVDCSDTASNNVAVREILGWGSKDQATRETAAALAFALAGTGQTVRPEDLSLLMYVHMSFMGQPGAALASRRVFEDHGVFY